MFMLLRILEIVKIHWFFHGKKVIAEKLASDTNQSCALILQARGPGSQWRCRGLAAGPARGPRWNSWDRLSARVRPGLGDWVGAPRAVDCQFKNRCADIFLWIFIVTCTPRSGVRLQGHGAWWPVLACAWGEVSGAVAASIAGIGSWPGPFVRGWLPSESCLLRAGLCHFCHSA